MKYDVMEHLVYYAGFTTQDINNVGANALVLAGATILVYTTIRAIEKLRNPSKLENELH